MFSKWFKQSKPVSNTVINHGNSIRVIHPYRTVSTWAFDDPSVGLVREPFVSGAESLIDQVVQSKGITDDIITLMFSENPFPGYDVVLEWVSPEAGGNWYRMSGTQQMGWLCPALFKYFETAPDRIYIQIQ